MKDIVAKIYAWNREIKEIHVPAGTTELPTEAYAFCYSLKKLYIPKSVKKLGGRLFVNIDGIDVYYEGSSKAWKKLCAPKAEKQQVYVAGPFDKYPYYNSEGSHYEEQTVTVNFAESGWNIRVHCEEDGQTLIYKEFHR